ncbi:helix-turn-helix domain-containing protein [Arthrobacter sp. HY1533]|uniref:helix-turn-helix domain-containing protein n=1 Tax=Arthrobacter sp. HY1533 TaxID=2970919 RepID=UPI0022B9F57C|nr:helix-turn-helix transcriptional regulator [Arthrobacter sp. HY1533]
METEPAPERVARRVRELALASRVTQATLARVLGTCQQTASRKLSGKIPFRLDEIDAVADALNVEPETLITRSTKK